MGVDRAIHVITEAKEYETMQPIHVSKILSKIATEEKADLVIVGKQVSESLIYRQIVGSQIHELYCGS